MKEKVGTRVSINERGVVALAVLVFIFATIMGFLASSEKKSGEENAIVFTSEDLDRIAEMRKVKDSESSDAEIYVYKDDEGKLRIGLIYENSKRR